MPGQKGFGNSFCSFDLRLAKRLHLQRQGHFSGMRVCSLLLVFFALTGLAAEKPDLDIQRFEGSGPEGAFLLYLVRPRGYLLDSQRPEAVRQVLDSGNVHPDRTYMLLWQPYSPDLFDWKGEESSPLGRAFVTHIHNQCYIEDPIGAPYVDHSEAETECYGRITLAHLRGESALYLVHRIWGDRLTESEFLGYFRYVVVFFTLVAFSLPALAVTLGLIGLLSGFLRARPFPQRVVKVVLPLVIGISWFMLWILIQKDLPWRGALVSFKLFIPMGGIFCGLGFLPVMWMADHLYFPENDPPRLWIVMLLYLIAPVLLAGAGAAGGSARAVSSSSSSSKSGDGGAGSAAGGGGQFGGGGASARF